MVLPFRTLQSLCGPHVLVSRDEQHCDILPLLCCVCAIWEALPNLQECAVLHQSVSIDLACATAPTGKHHSTEEST